MTISSVQSLFRLSFRKTIKPPSRAKKNTQTGLRPWKFTPFGLLTEPTYPPGGGTVNIKPAFGCKKTCKPRCARGKQNNRPCGRKNMQTGLRLWKFTPRFAQKRTALQAMESRRIREQLLPCLTPLPPFLRKGVKAMNGAAVKRALITDY